MLKNSTVTWEWIFSHMKKIESVLRSSMTGENVQRPFWTQGKTLFTKCTLQTLLIYSQLQKPGKGCFKCFVLRTCNFGFRSHLFLYQKFFCCQFNLKNTPFPFFATFAFSKTKLRFQVGPGALNFSGAPGPMWSESGTAWGIPASVEFLPSTSPLPCSEDHHLPLSDCEFSLIY